MVGLALEQRLLVGVVALALCAAGLSAAPFAFDLPFEQDPVPVDAIPDIGEQQQIVFTEWPGRSPQDIDDQVTYPLTVALLGIPEVKTIRSFSAFGFSTIYIIFDDDAEFYWSRSRVVEKLASLPNNTLPAGVTPQLGPDATALGQVYWYTLEGRDATGAPAGGWDLHELRTLQDYQVRYALAATDGVAEVASVGGFVQELQVDVDPDALRAFGVTLEQVERAVRASNAEVGARSTEISGVEYVIRGIGFVRSLDDLRRTVVAVVDNTPVRVEDVARVQYGPAMRRGALDRDGAEAVGGVVVARYGANPMAVLDALKGSIAEAQSALPSRVLPDGTVSQVTIVPFYDRSGLIEATVGTLETALTQQLWITLVVVLVLMIHLRSAMIVALLLPVAVLATFVGMRWSGVTANVVSLAGIAIAIGTMVDIGIVITENVVRRLHEAAEGTPRLRVIRDATEEVGGAVLTAVATTVLSFLPVFLLDGAEGKLFGPLATTKTYAIVASVLLALLVIPPVIWLAIGRWQRTAPAVDAGRAVRPRALRIASTAIVAAVATVFLSRAWLPLGAGAGDARNLAFVVLLLVLVLGGFGVFQRAYPTLLAWVLRRKLLFLTVPSALAVFGAASWLGFGTLTAWLPERVQRAPAMVALAHAVPGLDREFMPALDEGGFLYMPSTMPHASIGEALALMQTLDRHIASVPEVEYAVGKLGRAESPLDPAPVSMIETIIGYLPEYRVDAEGRRLRFARDADGTFLRDENGALVPDPRGSPYRNWRPEIRTQQDIWDAIVEVAQIPGLTSAPLLQPISARIVMLQSGIRAPMAVRLRGPSLEVLADVSTDVEAIVRTNPLVNQGAVNADRPAGKPYLEIRPDRDALSRYGITMRQVQDVVEVAIGGRSVGQTVQGRERYPIRVRYPRELRDTPERMAEIFVTGADGVQVPLGDVATLAYVRGPQMIRSEDTALVNYVMFDRAPGVGEVDAVEAVAAQLDAAIAEGRLTLPAGVSYTFAGSYENAVRAQARLRLLIPLVLLSIGLLLYLQFRSVWTTLMVFSGIAVALSGGFILLWCVAQPWFLDSTLFGVNLRDVFQLGPVNLSVAVWVGFIALFGIATDDGVVMATYLKQQFDAEAPASREQVRAWVIEAGCRRVRPCLMTTATTLLALLPILTSQGTGADIMIPMALPALGGMTVALVTLFVVPVLYAMREELRFARWPGRSS
jgi:Cu(I)/Ag(I) efflux system membrane protein CusA/SilA